MQKELVVIINGAGTNSMELKALYKKLSQNEKYFVYYPGFMPGVFTGDYFPKSKVKDFKVFIDETIEMIKDFNKVYLIGYSLGASTCAIISTKIKNLEKMVLIAPIFKNPNYSKFLKMLSYSVAYDKNLSRIQKVFFSEFIKRFIKVPKIHILHLQLYLIYTRKYLKKLTARTLIVESLRDEVVKTKSINFLMKAIKNDKTERYPIESSHFLFFDRAVRNQVVDKISDYLEEE